MDSLLQLQPAVIAIDGPAASGKSTVGHRLAQRLDYLFFDTGVMYRAVTFAALDGAVDIADQAAVTKLAETIRIDLRSPSTTKDSSEQDGRQITVLIDGRDVTWQIRTPEVERSVSPVSAISGVRVALTAQQRRIGDHFSRGQALHANSLGKAGIVMVGRDIGTVVMPDAPVKIFLGATPKERARRRCAELVQRGKPADFDTILTDIERRDQIDSQRALAPLRPAADAVIIDTSQLTPDEVVEKIVAQIRKAVGQ